MTRTLLLLLILLATFIAPTARADFETDLADTGHTASVQSLHQLRTRAEAGDADAQLNLGGLFFKGQGVTQDYAEAAKWFRMAAVQGQSLAQFNLGMMYATGQGVEKNDTESVQWYRAAAIQGLAVAQLNLGVAYATGQGILQDESEAVKWLRLAAEQGEPQAQFNLAVMYANGQGVKQDMVQSYRWAKLADAQGHETAKALMVDLSKRMSPEQIALAMHSDDTKLDTQTPNPVAKAITEGYYLQLGAFKSAEEAETFLEQIRKKRGNIGKPLSLYTHDNWVRVHIGPYASQNSARRNAILLKAKLGITPIIKQY